MRIDGTCQHAEKLMPYWMQFMTMITSTLFDLLAFGPVSVKPTADSAEGHSPKSLFRWLKFGLFLHALCIGIVHVVYILLLDDTTWWDKYTCIAITCLSSTNFVTACSLRGMEDAFEQSAKFNDVHNGLEFSRDNKVDTFAMVRSANGTAAAWLFKASQVVYFYIGVWVFFPFQVIAFVVFFPITVSGIFLLVFCMGQVLARLAVRLKMRGSCLRQNTDQEYQNPFWKRQEPDDIRDLYKKYDTDDVLNKGLHKEDAELLRDYDLDYWAFQYTNIPFDGLTSYFQSGYLAIVMQWSPVLASRFVASMQGVSWPAFKHAWVGAVFTTFGERHWYLYRDYMFSTISIGITTVNAWL